MTIFPAETASGFVFLIPFLHIQFPFVSAISALIIAKSAKIVFSSKYYFFLNSLF
jgi:hypothetical protein